MLIGNKSVSSVENRHLDDVKKQLDIQGYIVESPAKLAGRSGLHHEVDLYVEDQARRRFIVEFISSDSPVGEDKVMRLFAIRFDTNVDYAFMITDHALTEKAAELAGLYGIRVLDISGLKRHLCIGDPVRYI